jgi:hydroxymethylpyrimidine pyrophosphatase-like HAD family hydrolase
MPVTGEIEDQLSAFLRESKFMDHGGVMTDLDGTAVHELQGRVAIPKSVEHGLKALYELGRPLMINSLRFPLSVIRTFGKEWYSISNAPIPTVSLNGSQLGYLTHTADGHIAFDEIAAFPLAPDEIDDVLKGVRGLLDGGIEDLLLFYYPRDWRMGEIIWTPLPDRVDHVKGKYKSASAVTAVTFEKLHAQMLEEEICMIFLLVDVPQDRLMAYQHTRPTSFFTRKGVDKLFGAEKMAEALGINLLHSVGAGDTRMDRFLDGVGLAVIVGPMELSFHGKSGTLRLSDSSQLGEFLFRLAGVQRGLAH